MPLWKRLCRRGGNGCFDQLPAWVLPQPGALCKHQHGNSLFSTAGWEIQIPGRGWGREGAATGEASHCLCLQRPASPPSWTPGVWQLIPRRGRTGGRPVLNAFFPRLMHFFQKGLCSPPSLKPSEQKNPGATEWQPLGTHVRNYSEKLPPPNDFSLDIDEMAFFPQH